MAGDDGGAGNSTSGESNSSTETVVCTKDFVVMGAIDMENFEPNIEQWQTYMERMEQLFIASKVTSEGQKRSLLIKFIGATTYRLLRDLCQPTLPSENSYADLKKLLDSHFTPAIVLFKERRAFYSAHKAQGETAVEWHARIRRLAVNCSFGTALQSNLTDKFVIEFEGKVFDRLCEEGATLSLARALEIAQRYETPAKAVNAIQQPSYKKRGGQQKWNGGKQEKAKTIEKCFHCGKPNHDFKTCKFKTYTCNKCSRRGHLAAVCRGQSQTAHEVKMVSAGNAENNTNVDKIIHLYNIKCDNTDPYKIIAKVNDIQLNFELDSGSPVSIFPLKIFKSYFSKMKLNECKTKLSGYGGNNLSVEGVFCSPVEFNNKVRNLEFMVVDADGPLILGRDFLSTFKIVWKEVNNLQFENSCKLEKLLSKYKSVFEKGIGTFKLYKVQLRLEDNPTPIFHKPRPIPIAYKSAVEDQLLRLEEQGVISRVETSAWGTPLVPVLKPNGTIRICADYKVTLNKYLCDVKYPLPRIEDLFSKLNNGELFTKLDLSQAYNQFELDEFSKMLCAWSTHKGVFKMNRMPFGIKPASSIFQREIEKLLQGIPGVVNFIDDILITGKNYNEHLANLSQVLERLENSGLRLEKSKCEFFLQEVSYLGFRINKNGLSKTTERVEAILKAPKPNDVSQVRSFIGLVNYYGKFIDSYTEIMLPFYELLKADSKFDWDDRCEKSFEILKRKIAEEVTLAHFNPKIPIILTCDASQKGIGAILSHRFQNGEERPVVFASRILSKAEQNYSVLQKEALAIVFACDKFYQYLKGNHFILRTDHKPLISLLGENKGIPKMAASRIQRWALFLSGFEYKIEYVRGKNNCADSLSRFPLEENLLNADKDASLVNFIVNNRNININFSKIELESARDRELSTVLNAINTGTTLNDNFRPFKVRINELHVEEGVLMWGYRVVIPQKLRANILEELHSTHLGIVKSKSLARSYFWWPNLDKDLEQTVKSCKFCNTLKPDPNKAQLMTWPVADGVWQRVHTDFCGPIDGYYFLILIDSYSKWPEVFISKSMTTEFTISRLRETFARYGLPIVLVSDNGSQYTSYEFKTFLSNNNIKHKLTAPGHPSTNGAAENFVRTLKTSLKSAIADAKMKNSSISLDCILSRFLFDYRSVIHCATDNSPAKLMFGRELRNRFNALKPYSYAQKACEVKGGQIDRYSGKRDVSFVKEELVWLKDYSVVNKPKWVQGKIIEVLGPRNYLCGLQSGRLIKRHLDQLRKFTSSFSESDNESSSDEGYIPFKRNVESSIPRSTDTSFNSDVNIVPDNTSIIPLEQNENDNTENTESNNTNLRRSNRIRKPVEKLNL